MNTATTQALACLNFHFANVLLYQNPFPFLEITSPNISNRIHANYPKLSVEAKSLLDLLKQYRDHPKTFSPHAALPYLTHVSPFQKKVYSALCDIPYGKTVTYLDLAKKLKTASRAIGQACKRNPLPFLIPCHRVLAKKHLGGYAGKEDGFFRQVKIELLKQEGVHLDQQALIA